MSCPDVWAIVKENIKTQEGLHQFVDELKKRKLNGKEN
jgi:hypothetical protein